MAAGVRYSELYGGSVDPAPVNARTVGEFLRCSLGLSAWKQFQASRWALRVNPSSGNLHPTEAYIVWEGRVCHYAPREHALEVRCEFPQTETKPANPVSSRGFLVGLTSIFWREAWKYGERAFRYCQHDTGHAIGALRFAAALLGWRATILPGWPDAQIASLLGIDRDDDFRGAEREDAETILAVTAGDPEPWMSADPAALVDAVRRGSWHGSANTLSAGHVDWPIIDAVANATRYPGALRRPGAARPISTRRPGVNMRAGASEGPPRRSSGPAPAGAEADSGEVDASHHLARDIILRRRSALAFDPGGRLPAARFLEMLRRLLPGESPWDVVYWPPHVHLALFVHRVDGLTPGVYAFMRDAAAVVELQAAMRPEFLWQPIAREQVDGLFLLLPYDMTWPANRVSCDQDIAGDGFASLGMLARFDAALRERGEWFYRRLFWECGLIGQVLYLEAEAAGGRSTGIGCYYDEPVHNMLGLSGHAWQSLYHFSMGAPVEDTRLTTETGYPEKF